MNNQEMRDSILDCEAEFIKLISKRLGIILRNQNTDLMNSVLNACNSFKCSPKEYLNKLTQCADHSPLLEHLIADITIGETYFFRDKQQMTQLKNSILPNIINSKRDANELSLRIWSAGCSSGEEIYTIAMLLQDLLPDIERWVIHLLGTDINTMALRKGKQAVYSKWSLRSIPEYYKKRYFSEENNKFFLSSKIVDKVDFQYLNLNDNTYPSILNGTNSQDLIICRNVLIYLAKDSIVRVMKKMSSCLTESGTLVLGASDPIILTGTDLLFHHNEGMFFRRNAIAAKNSLIPQVKRPLVPSSPQQSEPPISLKDILKLLEDGCWQEILVLLDKADISTMDSQTVLIIKAKAAANIGKLDKAISYCQKCLQLDSTNKEAYFTYSLVLIELDRFDEAENTLRKTLFLDYKFVEAHFQLGLLLIKKGKTEAGLKALHNALQIIESMDPSHKVEGFKGLNYGRFSEILKTEIELVAGSAYDKKAIR